jgi:ATP-dependent DNA helicase PIF1
LIRFDSLSDSPHLTSPHEQILGKHEVRNRWRSTDILVIDEISMLSAELFDSLSEIGKRVRNNFTQPFGGLQLVVCGDFFQLPPVQLGPKNRFCFKSSAWQELFPTPVLVSPDTTLQVISTAIATSPASGKIITLDRVYRQKENQFLDILHEIRLGEVSEPTKRFLCQKVMNDLRRKRAIDDETHQLRHLAERRRLTDDGVDDDTSETTLDKPTKLFGYNRHVEEYNTAELNKLPVESVIFACQDWGFNDAFKNQLKNGSRLPERLELKIGVEVSIPPLHSHCSLSLTHYLSWKVMLLWNIDHSTGLVNGARGRVIGFEKNRGRSEIFEDVLPVIEFRLKFGEQEITETKVIIEQETEIKQGNT